MRVRHIAGSALLSLALLAGCSADKKPSSVPSQATQEAPQGKPAPANIKGLANPKKKYLGIYVEQPETPIAQQFGSFRKNLGKRPNMVKLFQAWDSPYDETWAKNVWAAKALPQLEWEPFKTTLKDIAAGKSDPYITEFAQQVKRTQVPVALSFGKEFNGWWYDWGTKKAKPAHFVAAYKRIHKIFKRVGASKVIWMWSPNVIFPSPTVKLKPYYPGDAYVDWIGVVGYYRTDPRYLTFETLFDPTLNQVAAFTKKPVLIAETGSLPGKRRVADITDLINGAAKRPNIIGLIWFNLKKEGEAEADWRLENSKASLQTFSKLVTQHPFGVK